MALVTGTQGNDGIDASSSAGVSGDTTALSDTVYAMDGDDIVKGLGGADFLYGGNGDDRLVGADGLGGVDGNDMIEGGFGNDSMRGEDGDDRLYGGDGNDAGDGGIGVDKLYGGEGIDGLVGGEGNDELYGGSGNDSGSFQAPNALGTLITYPGGLDGGAGNDKLYGGEGNDYLDGGAGTDVMFGGQGRDFFDFNSAGAIVKDVIRDFSRKEQDVIDLFDVDAKENKDGNQKFKYIGSDGFSGKAGELQFKAKKGAVKGDTDGNGKADFTIKVDVDKLTEGDFIL
jgi:Ca2+-binding RTX toxin-like protein